ncbi:MAG: glycoside hydrolase family 3 N-terminal domain-containing protein [Acutalibacter sp.]
MPHRWGVHASRKLLTRLLREEMGFAGVTVSDYSGVHPRPA